MKSFHTEGLIEAGCDEAGRGCLAGPVFAAAVILPPDYYHPHLTDSKQLDLKTRESLRSAIESEALYYAVASCSPDEIDKLNILWASVLAMHKALEALVMKPQKILVDGNRFRPYKDIPHQCIVKGDANYYAIAAASVLAKTYRDDYMGKLHHEYPFYNWKVNKGYPTPEHKQAILKHGISVHHRKSFRLLLENEQLSLF